MLNVLTNCKWKPKSHYQAMLVKAVLRHSIELALRNNFNLEIYLLLHAYNIQNIFIGK